MMTGGRGVGVGGVVAVGAGLVITAAGQPVGGSTRRHVVVVGPVMVA
jgi:hypothetical protein